MKKTAQNSKWIGNMQCRLYNTEFNINRSEFASCYFWETDGHGETEGCSICI